MTLREAFPEAAAPPRSQVQLDLEAMAVIAENGGWCVGTMCRNDGAGCAIGIASRVIHGNSQHLRAVIDALARKTGFYDPNFCDKATAVVLHNDGIIRDGNDAARWFRAAAVDA